MPTKTETTKSKRKGKGKGSSAPTPPPAPVTVSRIDHSPALFARARRELAARGLPVELSRITPVPGRQALDVDVTPRPALHPRR
jgi:hypothetical protein